MFLAAVDTAVSPLATDSVTDAVLVPASVPLTARLVLRSGTVQVFVKNQPTLP